MSEGWIFNIQRFCIEDGPGIRTTVFFKGCPLRCLWCSNPESQLPGPQVYWQSGDCIGCGRCVAACPHGAVRQDADGISIVRERCSQCLACVKACPSGAMAVYGKKITTREVLDQVVRDTPFYAQSGGGVTLSGGEPLSQPEFAADILAGCRALGLHTAVETAGFAPREALLKVAAGCDLFLYDVKCVTPQLHRRGTGRENKLILENLKVLSGMGARLWVRIPVIPGFNGSKEEMERIAEWVAPLPGIEKVDLLAYHSMGLHKYEKLGYDYPMAGIKPPGREELDAFVSIFTRRGLAAAHNH